MPALRLAPRFDLQVDTDSVAHASTLDFTPAAKHSTMFQTMDEVGRQLSQGMVIK